MKKLLILFLHFLLFYGYVNAQTTPLSFTTIASSPDLITPDRGAEGWIGTIWDNGIGGGIKVPAGNVTRCDDYYRFLWGTDIELSQDNYDWTKFDAQINAAIDSGRFFNFGIMGLCTACGNVATWPGGGSGTLSYPIYLHNLMQAETANSRDWLNADNNWIPNWNSTNYITRYAKLMRAVVAHLASTSHGGKLYKNVIGYVDNRWYGDFGEWHNFPYWNVTPTGRTATSATLKQYIDSNLIIFPNYPNVILVGAFDPGNASVMPLDVTYYALTATNAWGQMGWRRDQWGDPGTDVFLSNNPGSFNGLTFSTAILNKYKFAPIVGEPNHAVGSTGSPYADFNREFNLYHPTSFGNGNFPNTFDVTAQANVIAGSRLTGYRLALTGGSMSTTLANGGSFNVTLNWQNTGLAPPYWDWNVVYQLRNGGGTTVATWTSQFNPKFFLPSGTPTSESDNLVMPTGLTPASNYSLYVKVVDPNSYKIPLLLAITGRGADGAYQVRNNITVGAGGPSFNINAGADQSLSSGTTSTTVSGLIPSDTATLYVIWGESNAAGGAPNTPATAQELSARSNTKIFNHVTGVFENLQVGVNNQQNTFFPNTDHGMELDIPNLLDTGYSASNPVYICKIGISGSYICQWLPGGCASAVGPDPTVFDFWNSYIIGFLDPAIAKMNLIGKPYRIVFWGSMGLNDRYGQGTTPTTFVSKMTTFINNVRTRYSRPDIKFLCTNFNNPPAQTYDWSPYFLQMAQTIPGFYSIPVIGATYIDAGVHYDYQGFKLVDHNMQDTMLLNTQINSGIGGPYTILWTQIAGPNAPIIVSPTAKTTAITGMFNGNYTFRMTVTDSLGTSKSDDINIVINGIIPTGPHAVITGAGTIALPLDSVNLSGTSSTDDGAGTINAYAWSQLSGPNSATIRTPTGSATEIAGLVTGIYTFKLIVTDNLSLTNSTTATVTVNPAPATGLTIFTTQTPTAGTSGPDQAGGISTGIKFRSSTSGYITGVKFYKTTTPVTNSGTHIGSLYAYPSGTQLATATYSGETASGWQTVTFGSAVPILANTTYMVTYFGASGFYTSDNDLGAGLSMIAGISNPPLTALAGGVDGPNGVFDYSNSPIMPASTFHNGNYWLDVVFTSNQAPNAVVVGASAIALPITSVSLNSSTSTDQDGTIVSRLWTNVSGPTTPAIVTPSGTATNITGLVTGTYVFRLTVTDNLQATGTTTKIVTVTRGPVSFVIGNGAGTVNLSSMVGHQDGDTAYIATQTGVYTNLILKNLTGIIVRPQSGRPTFTTQSTFCNLIRVDVGYINFISAGNTIAIDATCGRIDSSYFHNMYFQDWASRGWDASGNYPYTYNVDSTYKWLRDKFDSIKYFHCGRPYQAAFGVSPINTDIMRRDTFSRHTIEATTTSNFEGVVFSGICYGCLAENNKYTSTTGRGASGDDGEWNGAGWWIIRNNYQYGAPCYTMRLFPMMELNDTGTTKFYNNGKFGGTQYGMVNTQVNLGDTIAGQRRGNGMIAFNNTMGNQINDTLGYWSTMFNLGQIAPNMHYYVINNFGFNIGNNPQRQSANGQPNNGKPFIAVNLGGWNNIGSDTANNQYYSYATVAKLDSLTTLFSNSLGAFNGYYLNSISPGRLLNGGVTNPLTNTDYLGNPYRVPPDLGYIQFFGNLPPPPIPCNCLPGMRKGKTKTLITLP